MIKQMKERYSGENKWPMILRVAELIGAAYLSSFLAMHGTVNEIKGTLQQLCKQTAALAETVDKHVQNYDIHRPHAPLQNSRQ